MKKSNLNSSLRVLREYVELIHDTIFGDNTICFLRTVRKLDCSIQLCKIRCKICMSYCQNPWHTNEMVNLISNFEDLEDLLNMSGDPKKRMWTFIDHRNKLNNCIANIMAVIGDCNWEGSSSMFWEEDYKEVV